MSKLSPSLPQPKDNSPALGGDRAIRVCPQHQIQMLRTMFGDYICTECSRPAGRREISVVRHPLPTDPPWFRVGRLTPKLLIFNVRRGLHPLGSALSTNEQATCGNCKHHCRVVWHNMPYQKCGLMRDHWTHGPATDVKLRWRGCDQWAAKEGEAGHE